MKYQDDVDVSSLVQLRGHDHDDAVLVEEPVDGLQPLHDLLAETDLVGVVLVLPESNINFYTW